MELHIIIFGPQGSGKGTQANELAKKYNLEHISTGAVFRAEIAKGTELGREVETLLDQGKLVSDAITNQIVHNKINELQDLGKGFILDGYPRTLEQAESIEATHIDHVFLLDISDEVAVQRLQSRFNEAAAGERRADDENEDAIRRRLESYHAYTKPLVAYYEAKGLLRRIDGEQTIPEVTESLLAVIEQDI